MLVVEMPGKRRCRPNIRWKDAYKRDTTDARPKEDNTTNMTEWRNKIISCRPTVPCLGQLAFLHFFFHVIPLSPFRSIYAPSPQDGLTLGMINKSRLYRKSKNDHRKLSRGLKFKAHISIGHRFPLLGLRLISKIAHYHF